MKFAVKCIIDRNRYYTVDFYDIDCIVNYDMGYTMKCTPDYNVKLYCKVHYQLDLDVNYTL